MLKWLRIILGKKRIKIVIEAVNSNFKTILVTVLTPFSVMAASEKPSDYRKVLQPI